MAFSLPRRGRRPNPKQPDKYYSDDSQTAITTQPSNVSQSQISELSKKVQSLRARADLANGAYILFLVLTVLSTMLLARWTGKANRAQDELTRAKDDELARQLREKDSQIASTNERALKLEKDAADAKKAQAIAEKSLLELQQLIKEPRTIDRKRADEILDWGEKGSVTISFSMIGDEPVNLAKQLAELLDAHGWRVEKVEQALIPSHKGIIIYQYGDTKETVITNWADAPEPAKTLHRLSSEAVIGNPVVETRVKSELPKDNVELQIAAKY